MRLIIMQINSRAKDNSARFRLKGFISVDFYSVSHSSQMFPQNCAASSLRNRWKGNFETHREDSRMIRRHGNTISSRRVVPMTRRKRAFAHRRVQFSRSHTGASAQEIIARSLCDVGQQYGGSHGMPGITPS